MPGINGELCESDKELRSVARLRKRSYREQSVPKSAVQEMLDKGWTLYREHKTTSKMHCEKTPGEKFEDEVWLTFHALGFTTLNKDRNCNLEFKEYTRQIDVLARDGDNVFVVECKSSENPGAVNAKEALEKFVAQHSEIRKALSDHWGHGSFGRVCHVVVVSSDEKRAKDEEYVQSHPRQNILLWSKRELQYMKELGSHVGSVAKNQIYATIFAGKRQKNLERSYPALRTRMQNGTCYSFLIPAKELINYVYVHHRRLSDIVQASEAYQRMLRKNKLKQIAEYIDEEDGYFPNSIILNFNKKKLGWDLIRSIKDVQLGTVRLPGAYGCAWVIDGQHRLYGAAKASKDVVLPVIAFEDLAENEQANLFVEINDKQTTVSGNLLWDLYSDIYRDSTDAKDKKLFQISGVAKILGKQGPLRKQIRFESDPTTKSAPLTLTTVCTTIKQFCPWDLMIHPRDSEKTPQNVARLISEYYESLRALWPEDWEKGGKGILLSNNGFGVFMMVFNDILRHLDYQDKESLRPSSTQKLRNAFTELMKPAVECAKEQGGNIRSKGGGRGPQNENARMLDEWIRNLAEPNFSPPRLEGAPITLIEDGTAPTPERISKTAANAEPRLREFIKSKLKESYGNLWWKQGMPGGLKKTIDDRWEKQVERNPELRRVISSNEEKFELLGLEEIRQIVVSGNNWSDIFQAVFSNDEIFSQKVRNVGGARDAHAHGRILDRQGSLDAYAALTWLAAAMGDSTLDPCPRVGGSTET